MRLREHRDGERQRGHKEERQSSDAGRREDDWTEAKWRGEEAEGRREITRDFER